MILKDYPMNCCAIVEASSFPSDFNVRRHAYSPEKWDALFNKITDHQKNHRRNCALITLSSEQEIAQEHAVRNGFKLILEFPNPHGTHVWLYSKVLWSSQKEYHDAVAAKIYRPPELTKDWARPAETVEIDNYTNVVETVNAL